MILGNRLILLLLSIVFITNLGARAQVPASHSDYFSSDYSYCMYLRDTVIVSKKVLKIASDESTINQVNAIKNSQMNEFIDFNCIKIIKREF